MSTKEVIILEISHTTRSIAAGKDFIEYAEFLEMPDFSLRKKPAQAMAKKRYLPVHRFCENGRPDTYFALTPDLEKVMGDFSCVMENLKKDKARLSRTICVEQIKRADLEKRLHRLRFFERCFDACNLVKSAMKRIGQ